MTGNHTNNTDRNEISELIGAFSCFDDRKAKRLKKLIAQEKKALLQSLLEKKRTYTIDDPYDDGVLDTDEAVPAEIIEATLKGLDK